MSKAAFPVVSVEWVDSASIGQEWLRGKYARKRARKALTETYLSAGLLIERTPHGITLAMSHDPVTGNLGGVWVIPATAIKSMTTYPPPKSR